MMCGGKIRSVVCVVVVVTLWGGILVSPAAGTITTTGDVVPPYDDSDPWILSEDLIVGGSGNAGILISEGSRLVSGQTRIGSEASGSSIVEVTGPGSCWDSFGMLYLGDREGGSGEVAVSDGACLIAPGVFLGSEAGSLGYLTVVGSGTTWQGGSIEGISDFEVFPADEVALSENSIVAAVGGNATSGYILISDGAHVTADGGLLYLGYSSNAFGSLVVTGPNSVWEDNSVIRVGHYGTGSLMIQDGGTMTTTHAAYIGDTVSTSRGSVIVGDSGSFWQIDGGLYVGGKGTGELAIRRGRVGSVEGLVGYAATGVGEVIVEGVDSLWENQSAIQIGVAGTGHLVISAGGTVTARDAIAGSDPNSEGVITVEGAGSALEVEQDLVVGVYGNATMSVSGGGRVSAMISRMGMEAGSTAAVTVTGTDSWWSGWGATYVGVEGQANLLVSDGAWVWDQGILGIGTGPGGVGTVVVTGTDSNVGGDVLQIGMDSGRGSMTITDGARGGASDVWVGAGEGALGEVLVSGPNSLWGATYDLTIGYYHGEGRLTVADGAHVSAARGFIGSGPGGVGTVVVTGADSLMETSHALYIGGDAEGPGGAGSLGIYSGGLVDGNDVTIWSTGLLTGDGTLRGDVDNRGTIRPGSSIGTLTIDGDLAAIRDTSVIEFEIDNEGNCDKLLVSGFVGFRRQALVPVPIETLVGTHDYTVVEADRIEERIQTLEWPYPAVEPGLIRSTIAYGEEPNSIVLRVTALSFDDSNIARTCNQRSLGTALDQIAQAGGNDLTLALQQLDTSDAVRSAYGQLSGQTTPSLAPVSVAGTTRHVGSIAGRLRDPAGGFAASDGFGTSSTGLASADTVSLDAGRYLFAVGNGSPVLGEKPWGVWGKGYGLYGDRESESGVPGYAYTVYGAAFGLDYRFTERLLLGVTAGYSEGDIDYSGSRDRSDVSATHGGIYGGYDAPRWYLDSVLTYTDLEYDTRRYVDLLDERLEADPSGSMFTAYFEAGLNWRRSERTLIQPLAGLQVSTLKIDRFTETGGDAALTFDDERYDSYKGSLGVRITRELFDHADGARMELELRGRWVHEFGDTNASFDAGFAADPGATFRVSDEDTARDSAVLGAVLDTWFTRRTRVFLDYGTELNPDHTVHVVTAGLEHRW